MSESRKRARVRPVDVSSPMLAGSYRQSMNAMWCGLLNGAWWYWAGGLYGGRIWVVEDLAEIELRVDAVHPTPLETMVREYPLRFSCKMDLASRRGVVAHMDLDSICESWTVRDDPGPWWLSRDAFVDAIHVCLATSGPDSFTGRRISLREYLRWCRTWATGVSDGDLRADGRAGIAKLVRNHRRLARAEIVWGPIVRSLLTSRCSAAAQSVASQTLCHPLQASPRDDWAGGCGWMDESARAKIVPAPRCAVLDQTIDDDEAHFAIDQGDTQCATCKVEVLRGTHDGMQRFGIAALHSLMSVRERLAVERSGSCVRVYARRLSSSPEMLTFCLTRGCLCSCYKSTPQRFAEWKSTVQLRINNVLVHWPQVSARVRAVVERNLRSSQAYLHAVVQALHARVCRDELSAADARMACELMCYLHAVSRESERCVLGSPREQVSEGASALPVRVDLSSPMAVLRSASHDAVEQRLALLTAAWVQEDPSPAAPMPAEDHVSVVPSVPIFDVRDECSVRDTIVAVLDRALRPTCPICGTHIWLESGCTAVLCAACGHRSCFACAKPELVNLDPSCTWADIASRIPPTVCFDEASRTYALNEHLLAWRLNREVLSADTGFSKRCARAGLSGVAPHLAPQAAFGRLRLTSHLDTRCAVYVEGDVSKAAHICHSRFSPLHKFMGSGCEADGLKLLIRCVRMLAESVAFSTINGRLVGTTDAAFASLLAAGRPEQAAFRRTLERTHPAVWSFLVRLSDHADELAAFTWSLNCPNPHRHPSCAVAAGAEPCLSAVRDSVLMVAFGQSTA